LLVVFALGSTDSRRPDSTEVNQLDGRSLTKKPAPTAFTTKLSYPFNFTAFKVMLIIKIVLCFEQSTRLRRRL